MTIDLFNGVQATIRRSTIVGEGSSR